ncbi:MAG: cell wall hydrolase [Novosphingobium sp.]
MTPEFALSRRAYRLRMGLATGVVLLATLLAVAALLAWRTPDAAWSPRALFGGSQPAPASAIEAALPSQPVRLLPLPDAKARSVNAAVPFVAGGVNPATPYVMSGEGGDFQNAISCLSAAVLYEAGDDRPGQAAVAQVILNRMRHPAYPKTVCGVVFQGSERSTGCQFTFTCDGSLRRPWPAAAWERARGLAIAALSGQVDGRVGMATHYHTDWVVPYWAASLDKIAQVGTHLFYKFPGAMGKPGAFTGVHAGTELINPKLGGGAGETALAVAAESASAPADDAPAAVPPVTAAPVAATAPAGVNLRGSDLLLADADAGVFVLALQPGRFPGDYAMTSLDLCKGRKRCTVVGYLPGDEPPGALPLPAGAARTASFYYDGAAARAAWNCRRIARSRPGECIPGTAASASELAVRDNPVAL